MPRTPRFRPHLRAVPLDDETVFLLGERERYLLTGPTYGRLAPLLDGRRTDEEIAEALAGRVPPPEVYLAIGRLTERGYVVDGADPDPDAAFWGAAGVDPAVAAARLAARPVRAESVGAVDAASLRAALGGAGVRVEPGAGVAVVLVEDYLDPTLADVNRRALASGEAWVPVRPFGVTCWIGPAFRPGEGPCWACLAHRLAANRPVERFVERTGITNGWPGPPRSSLRSGEQASLGLAAVGVARWIVTGEGPLPGNLVALDLASFALASHAVVRRPQCPECGDAGLIADRGNRPIVLAPRPKVYTEDGGHRCATPEQTCARLEHQISPITGVVSRLAEVPGRDGGPGPIWSATWFVCPATARPSFDAFSRASLGKGRTAAQSRASALCEAIERWSASFTGDEPRIRAALADLGDEAVHPGDLLHFSETQYGDRAAINAAASGRAEQVPLPLDERQVVDWTPVWSLTSGRRRLVPAAVCYADLPAPDEEQVALYDSNGDAAGNCLEEAVLQGLLELVERDAAALWWYSRSRRPGVDLASFRDAYFDEVVDHYRRRGWSPWVLDVTSDLGIPAFVAYAEPADRRRFIVGFGCHLDGRLAVQRALTEMNQLFDPAGRHPLPWDPDRIEDPAFLRPDEDATTTTAADLATGASRDLREDVLVCVERIASVGLETLVLDRTRPDVDLTVVKVIVPGLRHFWPRLGPGRLYDVPVRLGWIPRRLEEHELNPVGLLV